MGVSLCPSRRIDEVTASSIISLASSIGISEKLAWAQYSDLRADFLQALFAAEQELTSQGFSDASIIADFIAEDARQRLSL